MKIRDKKSGRVYSFDWRGATSPTKEQIDQIKQQQDSTTVDFNDVKGGASTSPLSVSNPTPEPTVAPPPEKSLLGKAYDFVRPAIDSIPDTVARNIGMDPELLTKTVTSALGATGAGLIPGGAAFGASLSPLDIATAPLGAAEVGLSRVPSLVSNASKVAQAGEFGAGALGLSQGEDKLANSLRVGVPLVGSFLRNASRSVPTNPLSVDDIGPPQVHAPVDALELPQNQLKVDAPVSPLEVPDPVGADFGPDYVNEVLRAGKRAQKGTEITPGIHVVKQGDADVVNFFDSDGTLLASGQVKGGTITDIAKVTKRFSPEELATIPPELRENATKAAREVRAKLHELGGVSDPSHRSPDATRAQGFYEQNLPVEDPDVLQLRQLAKDNNLPVDASKFDAETRSNLIVSLGGTPNTPPPPKPVKMKKERKPGFILNFPDWVNRRRASTVEGQLKGREFADLDEAGQQAIFDIQAGDKTNPRYDEVRKYLDSKYREVKASGSKVAYQENYLPQLWENKPEEVAAAFPGNKRIKGKSTFEFSKVIADYKAGIDQGLTPKFNKVSELASWYEKTANKGIADRGMFNMLRAIRSISTKPKPGWVAADPNVFPTFGKTRRNYYLPKETADLLNNYLQDLKGPIAEVAKFAGHAKNWVLSSGLPGTGVNMQGIKTLIGSTLASKNPFKGFARTAGQLVNPAWAKRELSDNLKDAPRFMRAGMKFSAEDFGLIDQASRSLPERLKTVAQGEGNLLKKVGKSVHEVHAHLFEDPMYQGILPATKLRHAKMIEADLLKKGVDPEEALSTAAHASNEIFGGVNLEELGRSKEFQNILRSTLLAPDHYESQIRLGKGVVRGLRGKKQDLVYRRMTRNLLGAYISASVSNKVASGKWMHENPEGKKFSIQIGKTKEGKERYLRPFGTMTDFVRIPYDIVESLAKGDIGKSFDTIANRGSVPASAGLHILSNRDWRGQKLYGPKIPLKDEVLNVGTELSNVVAPTYGQALGDYLTGKSGEEEALAAGLEAPLHYRKRPKKGIGVAP